MALSALRSREVRIAPGAENPAVVRSYQKRVRARRGFLTLAEQMGRRETGVPGVVHAMLGVADIPHRKSDWWTIGVETLDELIEDAFPARYEDRRLGLSVRQDFGESALCVPSWDVLGRPVGVWAAARAVNGPKGPKIDWRWRGIHGIPGGIGFLLTAGNTVPSWGNTGLILQDPGEAIRLHADRIRHSAPNPPVVLLPHHESCSPHGVSTALPNRPWVVPVEKELSSKTASAFQVARNLEGRVRLLPEDRRSWKMTVVTAADELIGRSGHWVDRMADLLENQMPGNRLAAFMSGLNWGEDLEARTAGRWPAATVDCVRQSVSPTEWRKSVRVCRDMTIVETIDGWIWEERGIQVAAAVPENVVAYKDQDGKTRHRGEIRHRGLFHPFDTDQFRIDPAAAIETALLDARVDAHPGIHPAIVDYIVEISLHFHGRTE